MWYSSLGDEVEAGTSGAEKVRMRTFDGRIRKRGTTTLRIGSGGVQRERTLAFGRINLR